MLLFQNFESKFWLLLNNSILHFCVSMNIDFYLYLVCGSERVFSGHILNIISQSLVGKDVGIFVNFVHSIFESQFTWGILKVHFIKTVYQRKKNSNMNMNSDRFLHNILLCNLLPFDHEEKLPQPSLILVGILKIGDKIRRNRKIFLWCVWKLLSSFV